MKLTNKQDAKEKIITAAIFTGVFLPVRLLFYAYVSQYWLGSLGLITAILLTMMILSQKNKLGWVGRIIKKQVMSFSKGRFGKFAMIQTVFFIYCFSLAIYGIENADPVIKQDFTNQLAVQGVEGLDDLGEAQKLGWTNTGGLGSVLFSLLIILTPNEVGFSMYSIINDFSDGWILHLTTVFLIEEFEILGLVIYFRYFYKKRENEI